MAETLVKQGVHRVFSLVLLFFPCFNLPLLVNNNNNNNWDEALMVMMMNGPHQFTWLLIAILILKPHPKRNIGCRTKRRILKKKGKVLIE